MTDSFITSIQTYHSTIVTTSYDGVITFTTFSPSAGLQLRLRYPLHLHIVRSCLLDPDTLMVGCQEGTIAVLRAVHSV